jgi:hypothetical protein
MKQEILLYKLIYNKNIYRIYYKMNDEYIDLDLDKVKHLVYFRDKTPINKYPEIVDNILNKQFN